MNIIKAAIDRPVAVVAAVLLVIMFGLVALKSIPIQLAPDVNRPVITVTTEWFGAAPAEVEREIINQQEEEFAGLEGLATITGRAEPGRARITLEFKIGTNMDKALLLVANRLDNGRTLWERELSSLHDMWLAGNSLFVLTIDKRIVALNRLTGDVYWVTPLPTDEEETRHYYEPIIINDTLWVVDDEGTVTTIDPQNGAITSTLSIADEIGTAPIIAGKQLYAISRDATLHRFYAGTQEGE